ncbi:urease accessory protein UreF [Salipiger pallidus]|uniref:Urease accessory protein UreF n=2 Tax=Salipiger pallidus TaxID=1775170 RepID=A0A8J2ZKH4_9RHOB|nr:urease accessory protein UreF [Salipiger pallidus]
MAMGAPMVTIIRTPMGQMITLMTMGTLTITDITTMNTDAGLVLHQLFSPSFPTGAFAWSHGLETAVETGHVTDARSLRAWLETVLWHGSGWSDAVLLSLAARGWGAEGLSELALALSPSAERRAETAQQGRAFAATVSALWQIEIPAAPYPVAAGLVTRALELPLEETLRIFLLAVASNLVSAGVRLVPLGQTDGQKVLCLLRPLCGDLAAKALEATDDDIGGFAPLVDIASQRHDMLYSRLFRS